MRKALRMEDETILRRLYLDEQKSIREIATLWHVSPRTIFDALRRYSIPRRSAGFPAQPAARPARQLQEATLREWYLHEERSINEIAGLLQVSTRTVFDALCRYQIPRRSSGHRKHKQRDAIVLATGAQLDEHTLRSLYLGEGRSIAAIATSIRATRSQIWNALVRWDIPRRQRGRPAS